MAKLYVIAGHGAGDPGAIGGGQSEAETVRQLAAELKNRGGESVEILDTNRDWYKDGGINSISIPKDSMLIELHRDSAQESARGAHIIIKEGMKPDSFDERLAANLGAILPGRSRLIVERGDLANVNRAAKRGINYRLAEVGFISNSEDRNIFNSRITDIADAILEAAGIKPNTNTPKPETPSQNVSGGFTSNGFGGTYRCTVDKLNVRDAPSLSANIVSSYTKGQTVVLDDWYKSADGYIWGRYTGSSSGKKRYIAVGKATGKPEPNDYLIRI